MTKIVKTNSLSAMVDSDSVPAAFGMRRGRRVVLAGFIRSCHD